jgi:hypothetical protein
MSNINRSHPALPMATFQPKGNQSAEFVLLPVIRSSDLVRQPMRANSVPIVWVRVALPRVCAGAVAIGAMDEAVPGGREAGGGGDGEHRREGVRPGVAVAGAEAPDRGDPAEGGHPRDPAEPHEGGPRPTPQQATHLHILLLLLL